MTRPTDPVKVVRAVPSTYRNDLYHTMDGYDWVYENPAYSKIDVARPGFFNVYREELRVGAIIECRVGRVRIVRRPWQRSMSTAILLGFCRRYAGGSWSSAGTPMAATKKQRS